MSDRLSEVSTDLGNPAGQFSFNRFYFHRWRLLGVGALYLALIVLMVLKWFGVSFRPEKDATASIVFEVFVLSTLSVIGVTALVSYWLDLSQRLLLFQLGFAIVYRSRTESFRWEQIRDVTAKKGEPMCHILLNDGRLIYMNPMNMKPADAEAIGLAIRRELDKLPSRVNKSTSTKHWDPRKEKSNSSPSSCEASGGSPRFIKVASEFNLGGGMRSSYQGEVVAAEEGIYLVFKDVWGEAFQETVRELLRLPPLRQRDVAAEECPHVIQFELSELPVSVTGDVSWPVSQKAGRVLFVPRENVDSASCTIWTGLRLRVGLANYNCGVNFWRASKTKRELQAMGWNV